MKTGTMTEDTVEFNYEIESVDIQASTIVVQYEPTDTDMSPIKLNITFFEDRREENLSFQDHLEHCIRVQSPCTRWRAQKLLIDNIANIQ